jgi:hypothetical protein
VPVTVEVEGLDELRERLAGTPDQTHREMRSAMTRSLVLLEGEMRRLAPRDTGRLQGSITHTITGGGANLTGRVGPSVQYGLYVEKGTRAHFPPIDAISGWARRHGMHPFALARAISRRGTRAQPFVEPSLQRHQGAIVRLFSEIGAKVAVFIAGGR